MTVDRVRQVIGYNGEVSLYGYGGRRPTATT